MAINARVQESGVISFALSSSGTESRQHVNLTYLNLGQISVNTWLFTTSQSGFHITIGQYSPMHVKDHLNIYSLSLFSDLGFNFCKSAGVQTGATKYLREGLSAGK